MRRTTPFLALLLIFGCTSSANRPPATITVYGPTGSEVLASLVPATESYKEGDPLARVFLEEPGTTEEGQVISGIVLRAWKDSYGARVRVWMLIPAEGADNVFTTDLSKLTEKQLGEFPIVRGQIERIHEMARLKTPVLRVGYGTEKVQE